MGIPELFNAIPFVELLGIEVTEAADGRARAVLSLEPEHATNPHSGVAHGGATYALADTAGGAAAVSLTEDVAPTVDMRIDYLAPATEDLHATAEVVRHGGSVAVVDVAVTDASDEPVATARGVYKTGGQDGGSPWNAGRERPERAHSEDERSE